MNGQKVSYQRHKFPRSAVIFCFILIKDPFTTMFKPRYTIKSISRSLYTSFTVINQKQFQYLEELNANGI